MISALMTVYNESSFVDYAIRACLPHVDHLVVVEGAYQETIALGLPPRSSDGTIEKINKLLCDKVFFIPANERTDKDQRNVGLQKIKELNPNGWLLIVDGDEVYDSSAFLLIKNATRIMERQNKLAAYFRSLTFVNDFQHYTEQNFPRLFKISPQCKFVDDNFMQWDHFTWAESSIQIPYIHYYHYAFCKGAERFETKKRWWETRFNRPFNYGWFRDECGNIGDTNHKIYEFIGKHPVIMQDHPLYKNNK